MTRTAKTLIPLSPPLRNQHHEFLEMNAAEDDDVKLLRASASLLSDLERLLLSLLRRKSSASEVGAVHHHVKEADLHQIIGLVSSVRYCNTKS
jgi:hypothetical protein